MTSTFNSKALNPNATPFVSKNRHTIILSPSKTQAASKAKAPSKTQAASKMSKTQAPSKTHKAQAPSKMSKAQAPSKTQAHSKTHKTSNHHRYLDNLNTIATSVAEFVLKPISHQELEFALKKRHTHFK